MTRLEQLTSNLADELLTAEEARELDVLLAEDGAAGRQHLQILEIEAELRALRQNLDLAPTIMANLRNRLTQSVTHAVMSEIKTQSPPERPQRGRAMARSIGRKSLSENCRRRGNESLSARWRERFSKCLRLVSSSPTMPGYSQTRSKFKGSKLALLALAGSVALVIGVGLWYFAPTTGEPVLAEMSDTGLSLERSGNSLVLAKGRPLQSGDALRTSPQATAAITFGSEKTRITLQLKSEFRLTTISRGKRFALETGKIEASVARQPPFKPLIISTPQAEAQVVGTTFTLSATNNSTRLDVAEGKVQLTRLSDNFAVEVPAGQYAFVAASTELNALPQTGGLLREWWGGISDRNIPQLRNSPRLREKPDYSDVARLFELEPVKTNGLVVRFRGYVHPPVTGEYEFWLVAVPSGVLYLSPENSPDRKGTVAFWPRNEAAPRAWDQPHLGNSPRSVPTPLVAGRRYYIEALLLVESGQGHMAVAWKPPGGSRQLLNGEFLSPYKPK